jgi:hypothetical protein
MADFSDEDDALLAELGVEVEAKRVGLRTPQQERIIAGFEDIQRFVEEHGHAPRHGEGRDIFERIYEPPQFYRRPIASFHATISNSSRCA